MIKSFLTILLALLVSVGPTSSAAPPEVKRIVFLGDSITYGGTYIEFVEAAMIAAHPDRVVEVLNVGLPSETVSGLSEEGHAGGQFPRPDLHERLDRVLAKAKPDLVIACYGMNCGIYHPLSEERFQRYQDGMRRLREKVIASDAQVLHLTPPVFDPVPIRAKLLPVGRDSYPSPYEGYDDVLAAYSDWLLGRRADGWQVLDVHGAMKAALAARREKEPIFTFARDGVHPNTEGHLVMARPLLDAWGLRVDDQGTPLHPNGSAILALVQQKQRLLKAAWLSETGHKRPGMSAGLPLAEAQAKAAELDKQARELARASAAAIKPGVADLILVAGQSNAVGYDAKPSELPADPVDKNVLFWWRCGDPPPDEHDSISGGAWTFLRPQPLGDPKQPRQGRQYGNFAQPEGGFGPEIGLARTLMAKQPDKRLAIVKAAFSGTGLSQDWNHAEAGEAGACYRALVAETRAAIAAAEQQGLTLRPRALVWVQGESDANAQHAPRYAQTLTEMMAALRRELQAPELVVLLGVNTRFGGGQHPFMPKIVEAQQAVAEKDARCVYVDTSAAPIANAAHFSSAGTLQVGRLFAESLLHAESDARPTP